VREEARPVRVLFDTNILLDVVLAREPWEAEASALLDRAARGEVEGYVAAHAVTTIHYLVERARTRTVALSAISDLLSIVDVAPVGRDDIHRALTLGLKDFEDAVQVVAALGVGADYLITRDAKHFRTAPIEVRTPGEVLALYRTRVPRGGV
jgi:predicted nucleic acid-binding protein